MVYYIIILHILWAFYLSVSVDRHEFSDYFEAFFINAVLAPISLTVCFVDGLKK